jgi:DNA polymerase III subunit delta
LPKGAGVITTLTGSNSFLLRACLRELVDRFVAEHTDLGLERLDGEEAEYDRIREALESLPFLASKKLVVLRNPGANKQFTENAEKLLGNLGETTDVIIVEPKLDKRSGYYKYLRKNSDYQEFSELDEHGLSRWLVNTAKERGGQLSAGDARYLVERVGVNQQQLDNELTKLIHYNPQVTRETISLLVEAAPQSTVFELLDAAFAGNSKRAMALYDEQRAARIEPQQILAMIAWQLHVLALVKAAGKRDPAAIAKEARLNPYVVRKSAAIAARLSGPELKQLVANALRLDIRLKSEALDADEALRLYLLGLAE